MCVYIYIYIKPFLYGFMCVCVCEIRNKSSEILKTIRTHNSSLPRETNLFSQSTMQELITVFLSS